MDDISVPQQTFNQANVNGPNHLIGVNQTYNPEGIVESNKTSGMKSGEKPLSERDIQKLSENVFDECRSLTNDSNLKQILDNNPELIYTKNKDGNLPLHTACRHGNYVAVELLLANGANINAKDNKGKTALHYSAETECIGLFCTFRCITKLDVAKLLLEKGANVNAIDETGSTPFHEAALSGNINAIELLLENGANIYAKDNNSRTACDLAFSKGYYEVSSLLRNIENVNAGDCLDSTFLDSTFLHYLVTTKNNKYYLLRLLLEKGVNVNAVNKFGKTLLHMAISYNRIDIVELFLEYGANVVNAVNNKGKTALHIAAIYGNIYVIKLLLKNDANVYAKDNSGKTALHIAATNGYFNTINLLLEKGANVNAIDETGSTPLHMAATSGNINVIELLLAKGANINAQDNEGRTALHIAIDIEYIRNRRNMVLYLLEKGININWEFLQNGITGEFYTIKNSVTINLQKELSIDARVSLAHRYLTEILKPNIARNDKDLISALPVIKCLFQEGDLYNIYDIYKELDDEYKKCKRNRQTRLFIAKLLANKKLLFKYQFMFWLKNRIGFMHQQGYPAETLSIDEFDIQTTLIYSCISATAKYPEMLERLKRDRELEPQNKEVPDQLSKMILDFSEI